MGNFKKLKLNKEVIMELNASEQNVIRGGGNTEPKPTTMPSLDFYTCYDCGGGTYGCDPGGNPTITPTTLPTCRELCWD